MAARIGNKTASRKNGICKNGHDTKVTGVYSWGGRSHCRECHRNERQRNKDRNNKSRKIRYHSIPLELRSVRNRDHYLKKKYSLGTAGYDEMFEQQHGCCVACGRPEDAKWRGKVMPLAVDHDHVTGTVRGLLCIKCNQAVGMVRDSAEIALKLSEYLTRTAARTIQHAA
jgi:hypothetical protein